MDASRRASWRGSKLQVVRLRLQVLRLRLRRRSGSGSGGEMSRPGPAALLSLKCRMATSAIDNSVPGTIAAKQPAPGLAAPAPGLVAAAVAPGLAAPAPGLAAPAAAPDLLSNSSLPGPAQQAEHSQIWQQHRGAGERRDSVLRRRRAPRQCAAAPPRCSRNASLTLLIAPPSPPSRTVRAPASCGQGLKRPPRPGHDDLGVERLNKKPMSTAHKAKIAAGVKVSPQVPGAHKATSKPKPKPKPKPAPSNPDHGRQMRTVVDKLERRAAVQKNMARIRKIRGGSVVALAPNVN